MRTPDLVHHTFGACAIVVTLGGCSIPGSQATPAVAMPQATPAIAMPQNAARNSTSGYVYVVDRVTDELLAYPLGNSDPRPVRTIKLSSRPFGVATDHEGNVYVTEQNSNDVAMFGPHIQYRKGFLTPVNGISNPTGVTVDSHDDLFVASGGKVLEFAPGSKQPFAQFDVPSGFGIAGIAVDKQGTLFAVIFDGPGGYVEEFSHGARTTIAGTASQDGIAVTANGDLAVACASTLLVLAPPQSGQRWVQVSSQYFGLGEGIRLLAASPNGTIYVPLDPPVNQVSQRAAVVIVPSRGPQHRITFGLEHPMGVAAGV